MKKKRQLLRKVKSLFLAITIFGSSITFTGCNEEKIKASLGTIGTQFKARIGYDKDGAFDYDTEGYASDIDISLLKEHNNYYYASALYAQGVISEETYNKTLNNIVLASKAWDTVVNKANASAGKASTIRSNIKSALKDNNSGVGSVWKAISAMVIYKPDGSDTIFGKLVNDKGGSGTIVSNLIASIETDWNSSDNVKILKDHGLLGKFLIDSNAMVYSNTYGNNEVGHSETVCGVGYRGDNCTGHEIHALGGKEGYEPLKIVDADAVKSDFDEVFEFPIYVLNPDLTSYMASMGSDPNFTVDDLYNNINSCFTQDSNGFITDIDDDKLRGVTGSIPYFVQAVDDNGNPISFSSMADDTSYKDIVKRSVLPSSSDIKYRYPGYDLVVTEEINGEQKPAMAISMIEFNSENMDKLTSILGFLNFDSENNKGKYAISRNGTDNAVYLLEYPVSTVDQIFESDNEFVTCSFKEAGIGINILTGKTIRYQKNNDDTFSNTGKYIDEKLSGGTDMMYYTSVLYKSDSAKASTVPANSSFAICGYTETNLGGTRAGGVNLSMEKVTTARLILRDYLELTYAPSYVSESNLVVFGRKIRLDTDNRHITKLEYTFPEMSSSMRFKNRAYKLNGSMKTAHQYSLFWRKNKDNKVAGHYVTRAGDIMSGMDPVYITDLCDAKSLTDLDYNKNSVINISVSGEAPGEKAMATGANFDNNAPRPDELQHITFNGSTNADDYKSKYKTSTFEFNSSKQYVAIKPTLMFPGQDIGKADASNVDLQRFWGLAVKTGMFSNGLFSNWIHESTENASVQWWNKYLTSTGFKYQVSKETVENYVASYYKNEATKYGIVLIDLETVKDIQEIFEKEADNDRIAFIRTVFISIGWLLMVLSIILMLLWIIDTNTDLGFSLLEKVTFGHWIAVKYEEDLPNSSMQDERQYVTGKSMIIKCIIIIAVGILLIRVNVFYITRLLVNSFGEVASRIEKLIRGLL